MTERNEENPTPKNRSLSFCTSFAHSNCPRETGNNDVLLCLHEGKCGDNKKVGPGALSIQPKIPVISVATSNGTDHFGLVRPEYSGPALKVVLFDRSGHFGRSDRNVPFHLTKLLSPVPLFCILLARTITKRAVAWVGSVQPE